MRARVERTERAAKRDEMILAGNLDISKAYIRSGHTQMNSSYKTSQKWYLNHTVLVIIFQ